MIASVGDTREQVWRAVRQGRSGVRSLRGLKGIPDDLMLAATVDLPRSSPTRLKAIDLCHHAAAEAMADAGVFRNRIDRERFGCMISGHMGDTRYVYEQLGHQPEQQPNGPPWWAQWLPNTGCSEIADRYQLRGPRLCHSTACASGLVEVLSAVRAIEDGQCDIALAGSGEAIDPLFAAGFRKMRVLAYDDDPQRACRPFDRNRQGFVMGEGAAMFVIERLSHAMKRGARIYAEIASEKMLAQAHHVTGLDLAGEDLSYLMSETLRKGGLKPRDIGYINAHGTGTEQNDLVEMRAIRNVMGSSVDSVCVSATKSMLGHLVNAAGSVELAITALTLRDGFAPPTLNLTDPDPECAFDCLPFRGRSESFQHALKISVAFGGHLVAVVLRRWDDAQTNRSVIPAARAA